MVERVAHADAPIRLKKSCSLSLSIDAHRVDKRCSQSMRFSWLFRLTAATLHSVVRQRRLPY